MEKLTIFTTPTCPKCRIIKMKLEKKGIFFEECQDVEYMKSLGINGVPVVGIPTSDPEKPTLMRDMAQINKWVESL